MHLFIATMSRGLGKDRRRDQNNNGWMDGVRSEHWPLQLSLLFRMAADTNVLQHGRRGTELCHLHLTNYANADTCEDFLVEGARSRKPHELVYHVSHLGAQMARAGPECKNFDAVFGEFFKDELQPARLDVRAHQRDRHLADA